ncbi:hypothetical protein DRO58_04495, partial [Candidatus Bathyarchaeota archaeon]
RVLLRNTSTGEETSWIYLNASDGDFDEREEDATGVISVDGLQPGTYTVVVQAIDSGGNVGANYTALTLIRLTDILGPEVVSLSTELNKTVKTLNVTALVSDEDRGGSNITIAQCRLYNSTFTTGWLNMTALDGSYDSSTELVYTVIDVSALSPGVYTVEVGAVDSMGNISENRTVQVVIDFEPPEIYALSGPVYNPASKTLSIEANVTDIGHGGSNITIARCRLYNDTYDSDWVIMTAVKGAYNTTSEVRVNGTINLTGLTSGLYNLEVEGYDSAWNRGNITVENIQLDLEAPAILNLEALYNSTGLELNVTALVSDIGRGGSDITGAWCRVLDSWGTPVTDWMEMSAKDGSYDSPEEWVEYIFSNLDLYPGVYTVVVNAADSAGNMGNNMTSFLAEGWLTGWQYRKSHTIIGSTAGAVTDYQVKIKVYYGGGSDSGENVYLNGKCQPDFDDIRFTASDGETLLSYWIEEKVDGNYAIVWVKIPSIPANPDTAIIYIYYGNPTATSESDEDATFISDTIEILTDKQLSIWGYCWRWWCQCPEDPFNTYYEDSRTEFILFPEDLTAEGKRPVKISAFAFYTSQKHGRPNLRNFRIRLQHTTQTDLDGWTTTGWTLVFGPTDVETEAGTWETCTFHTPFYWNQGDNLLVDISRDDDNWRRGGGMYVRITGRADQLHGTYHDSLYSWPYDNAPIRHRHDFVPALKISGLFRNYIDPEPSHGGWGSEESFPP